MAVQITDNNNLAIKLKAPYHLLGVCTSEWIGMVIKSKVKLKKKR
jgi:hypothetical protein